MIDAADTRNEQTGALAGGGGTAGETRPTTGAIGTQSEFASRAADRQVDFRPIFICGCQRSGTTALAVMFDRHPRIAIPRETQFFNKFAREDEARTARGAPAAHEDILARAMRNYFISRVGVTYEQVLEVYRLAEPTYPNLLRAILEAYCGVRGKPRPGEKTCDSLLHARSILKAYPTGRMICIVRDGRDVVRSLLKARVVWGKPPSFPALCLKWNHYARQAIRVAKELPADRFTMVRFEDLMTNPRGELQRLCTFVGEEFDPAQIQGTSEAGPVQACEAEWKSHAKDAPDASRVAAWRRCRDPQLIARLSYHLGPTLRALGYPDADSPRVGLMRRLRWSLGLVPYRPGVYPVALYAKRALNGARSLVSRKRRAMPPEETGAHDEGSDV